MHSWMFPGLEAFRVSSEVGSVCSGRYLASGFGALVSDETGPVSVEE